jgi:hypothetical protein
MKKFKTTEIFSTLLKRPNFPFGNGFCIFIGLLLFLVMPKMAIAGDASGTQNTRPIRNFPLEKNLPTAQLMQYLNKPNNAEELIKNIKIVTDTHLLLRDDFYTQKNINQTFGGESVDFRTSNESGKYVEIIGLNKLVKPIDLDGGRKLSGLGIHFSKKTSPNGETEVELFLIARKSGVLPSFNTSENIFGKNWEKNWEPPSPHRILKAATKINGNSSVLYKKNDGDIDSVMSIEFAFDATIYILAYSEKKNAS